MTYKVLHQDEDKLRKLLELNSYARERFANHWINQEFYDMDYWRKVMDDSMDEINLLVRKREEDEKVRDMLKSLKERLANDESVNLTYVEKVVFISEPNKMV